MAETSTRTLTSATWPELLCVVVVFATTAVSAETVWLDTLDLAQVRQGWGRPQASKSVQGGPLSLGGRRFTRGLGTHAESGLTLELAGSGARRFEAYVGVDDEVQSGRGSVEFLVIGDGKVKWRGGVFRSGEPARRVRVDLRGIRYLNLVVGDGEDGEDEDHADWADARVLVRDPDRVSAVPFTHFIEAHLDHREQEIDGFGASDCWSMHQLSAWSQASRSRIADLLFSRDRGIGLSVWRFNVGAGPNARITHGWRSTECFEVEAGRHDWTRQAGQRWFLRAAKARGVDQFVAFANSPPARMTKNGLTFCTPDVGSTNLKRGHEQAYGRFLADVVEHFAKNEDRSERIAFDFVSPVNEPQWDWESDAQEGNRASNDDLKRIYIAVGRELRRRRLSTKVLGVESGDPAELIGPNAKATEQHETTFGRYLDTFCSERRFAALSGRVIAGHSYWANDYRTLLAERRRLRQALDRHFGWRYWQTEYCVMRGPRGQTGWGRDLGMESALWVARIIHCDLTVANASAWHWWTAVSGEDFKDGLIHTNYRKAGDLESIEVAKRLWVLGHFSRFVRPAMVRVDLSGANHSINGLLASAFAGHDGALAVVLVNMRHNPERVRLAVRGHTRLRPYLTGAAKGQDLLVQPEISLDEPYSVPARSVVTLVSTPETQR
ncbi:glycoside hydrolase [Planctomycetota bacterium]